MTNEERLKELTEADEMEDGIAWYEVQWLIARVKTLTEAMMDMHFSPACPGCVGNNDLIDKVMEITAVDRPGEKE